MNNSSTFQTFRIGTSQSLLRTAGNLLVVIAVLIALPATAHAQLAWAHVNADGTVGQDSGNITVSRPAAFPGGYCIGVTGGTAQVAVVSLDSLPNLGGTVQAGVFFASVCSPFPNAQDILVITRPQAQDGGSPGQDRAFYIIVSGPATLASPRPIGMPPSIPKQGGSKYLLTQLRPAAKMSATSTPVTALNTIWPTATSRSSGALPAVGVVFSKPTWTAWKNPTSWPIRSASSAGTASR